MTCVQMDCTSRVYMRGLCSSHYHQFNKALRNPDRNIRVGLEPERFWRYVKKSEGCWNWKGGVSDGGYGVFSVGSRPAGTLQSVSAHRYAWVAVGNTLEIGMQLDHLCKNRRCVRPDHLEQVTARENTMRSNAPSAVNAAKTECCHGHPFTDENTYFSKAGSRHCRTCARERGRIKRAKLVQIEMGLAR